MSALRFIFVFMLCAMSFERGFCQELPQGVGRVLTEDLPGNQRFDLTFATSGLLRSDKLDELKLTAKQKREIRDVLNGYSDAMEAIPNKLRGMQDASEARSAGFSLAKEAKEQLQAKIDAILSPEQEKMLRTQLVNEFRKKATILELLQSPWIRTRLEISDDQLSRIVDRAEMEKIMLKRKMVELLKKVEKEMLTELSAEQRQKLTELVGR